MGYTTCQPPIIPSGDLNAIVLDIIMNPFPLIPPTMIGEKTLLFRAPGSPVSPQVSIQRAFVRRAIEFGVSEPDVLVALLSTFCTSSPFIGPPSINMKDEILSVSVWMPKLA